jgi:hypothetical protein
MVVLGAVVRSAATLAAVRAASAAAAFAASDLRDRGDRRSISTRKNLSDNFIDILHIHFIL